MKQEDKELLLKDLCSRLPYGVKCKFEDIIIVFEDIIRVTDGESEPFYDYVLSVRDLDLFINHKNFYIKPYLRPMSSMTEEEKEKYNGSIICYNEFEGNSTLFNTEGLDYLNKNMFDYRGLIPKGLAWEAPDGMYK